MKTAVHTTPYPPVLKIYVIFMWYVQFQFTSYFESVNVVCVTRLLFSMTQTCMGCSSPGTKGPHDPQSETCQLMQPEYDTPTSVTIPHHSPHEYETPVSNSEDVVTAADAIYYSDMIYEEVQ